MTRVDYDRRLHGAYRDGRALSDETGRLWMAAVGRHLGGARGNLVVPDLGACAAELYRVIKPGGSVFVRNTFSGRFDGVPLYRFFPSARAIDEVRLPRVEQVRATFEARGFALVTLDTVEQQIDVSLRAHYERMKRRALSTFELMTDAEFHEGLERMRQAVELEIAPAPVMERVDLLVLRRQGT